jgi:hypothetical protein
MKYQRENRKKRKNKFKKYDDELKWIKREEHRKKWEDDKDTWKKHHKDL